jgi:predicted ATPase
MPDGTLRALGILVALFQAGDLPLVGIDEPETGLHPAAVAVLLEALIEASAARQVLVTSHSPDFLDSPSVDTGSILAVLADMGSTYAGPLDAIGREALRRRLYTTGEIDRLRPDREALAEAASMQLDLLADDREERGPASGSE